MIKLVGTLSLPFLSADVLTGSPCTVGELVDFANDIPECLVAATLLTIAISLLRCRRERSGTIRRRLLIAGTLLNRYIFEIERIPRERSRRI